MGSESIRIDNRMNGSVLLKLFGQFMLSLLMRGCLTTWTGSFILLSILMDSLSLMNIQGFGGRQDLIMDLSLDAEVLMQIEIMDTIGMREVHLLTNAMTLIMDQMDFQSQKLKPSETLFLNRREEFNTLTTCTATLN